MLVHLEFSALSTACFARSAWGSQVNAVVMSVLHLSAVMSTRRCGGDPSTFVAIAAMWRRLSVLVISVERGVRIAAKTGMRDKASAPTCASPWIYWGSKSN